MRNLALFLLAVLGVIAIVSLLNSEPDENHDVSGFVGHWQSTDDVNSEVVYNADGTMQDIYSGEVLGSGTWEIPPGSYAFPRLETNIDGNTYTYSVLNVESDAMSLSYLARGNTLNYRRLDEGS